MIVKLFKNVFLLGFYAVGLVAVLGTWDYIRQAKAEAYDYTLLDYRESVLDRHGTKAEITFGLYDTAAGAAMRGAHMLEEAGVLRVVGIDLAALGLIPSESPSLSEKLIDAAFVQTEEAPSRAPDRSLLSRARVLQ